jgi:HSP20 family protein
VGKALGDLAGIVASSIDDATRQSWQASMPKRSDYMDEMRKKKMWVPYSGPTPQSGAWNPPSFDIPVAVDVEEYADSYALWLDVPGLQKSDVKVQVFPSTRSMTISGERKRPDGAEPTERVRHERRMGKFSRTVKLAKDLDISTIAARVDRGVLHMTARKVPAAEPVDDSVEISID